MLTNLLTIAKNPLLFTFVLLTSALSLTSCGGGNQGGLSTIQSINMKAEKVKQPVLSTSQEERDDPIASQIAMKYAGFPKKTPDGYWYSDTKETTSPSQSFGVFSKASNQLILFLVFDDNTATSMLANFVAKPPYTATVGKGKDPKRVDNGKLIIGDGEKFEWILSDYPWSKDPADGYFRALVGGFNSVIEGKSILVVARAYDDSEAFNHTGTMFILDALGKDRKKIEKPEETEKKDEPEVKVSTAEEIKAFLEGAEKSINENLTLPEKIEKISKKYWKLKKKDKKWKETHLLVGVNREGSLRTLGDKTKVPTEENKMIVKALIEAVNAVGKFKGAPTVKTPEFKFEVRLKGTKAVVMEPKPEM